MPVAVQISASEMPAASIFGSPLPKLEISLNVAIMPMTVPSRPSSGPVGRGQREEREAALQPRARAEHLFVNDFFDVFLLLVRRARRRWRADRPRDPECCARARALSPARSLSRCRSTFCRSRFGGQPDARELKPLEKRDEQRRQTEAQQRNHDQAALGDLFVKAFLERGQLEGIAQRRIERQLARAASSPARDSRR